MTQAVPWLVGSLLADDGTYAVPKGRIFGSCLALGCVLIFFLGCVGARRVVASLALNFATLHLSWMFLPKSAALLLTCGR